jgi:hypothetical protein
MPAQCRPLSNPPGQASEHVCRHRLRLTRPASHPGKPLASTPARRMRFVEASSEGSPRCLSARSYLRLNGHPAKERNTPASERPPPGARHPCASTLDSGRFRRPQRGAAAVRLTFGIGRPTSDQQPRPRSAGVSSWSPGHCDAAIDEFFGSTAIRLNCATAVPGILAACIPDSVLIAASESHPLPPGARSAGQTSTPNDGSVPPPSAGASRVDPRLVGAHALRYRHETGIAPGSGRRASRLPRRPSGTEPGRRQLVVRD